MPTEKPITLRINGHEEHATVPPHRTLLETLRELGHVEVKCGCEKGDCGACAVLIDDMAVDVETGEVQVLKSVAAHDVGQCINPSAVEGQIHGGVSQGQGYALSEAMEYDQGRLITPSFSEYLIPTSMDLPNVQCILLESRSGLGPFGAKGIGEPCMTPVAPAIANAVADAIGTRIFELPITPERIVNALGELNS